MKLDGQGREVRMSPSVCMSMYCGRGDCTGCRHKPERDEFDAWVERTKAERLDWIWCPRFYTAMQPDPQRKP